MIEPGVEPCSGDTPGSKGHKRIDPGRGRKRDGAELSDFLMLPSLSQWAHSFTRLFTVSRSALWERLDLLALLKSHGTASGRFKVVGALQHACLPGFEPVRR